jgi:hypothetical protein
MRKIRPVWSGLWLGGGLLGLASLSGCSSAEQTGDTSAPKVSKRDEAGKKFPFADAPAPKQPGGSGKKPSK